MEETISLQELFKTLKKRLGLIALITIIAITISGVVSFWLLTPIYQSSTQILVTQSKQDQQQQQFNSQDIQANLQLINTYNVIIKSPAILGIVKEEMNLERSVGALINQVTVNSAQNSQVVNIQVQDEDPKMAVDLANKIATVFQSEIKVLMEIDNVNILTPAELGANPSPIKPDPMLNMAIAAVIGLMLGVGLAFLLEYLDTTMKDEQDVEEILDLPIIGLISPIPDSDIEKMKVEVTQRRRRGRG
ncbi:capsular biosynthesis protein [Sporosarcina sp. Marseille-Q4063]|uniref:YveK family protein n=1 Tax=Sporosarcina sp. Marseille-Q4063 TaxID=2810514 RepID=UPI001BAF28C9|nr:Wzz/FepE/Etk N-terminal domain-containing protein [Sporosarcina sp. Marseille-Q4063]QUW21243.1 capsular biosynthesis protein [Sporosarcina sp. Marseille-Q4063]